jgi:uncharacterized protein with HEPN domain
MSSNRDIASLLDIAKTAKQVLKFKGNLDKTAFLQDDKTQSAILYQLLIIGEAVKRLSQELRQQHPEIPWSLMAGIRDNLIHQYDVSAQYFGVDNDCIRSNLYKYSQI